jgi:ABC-type Fe3+-siderophore transport system permease subunit
MSRSAAMQLNVFSDYTYTLETIIQAGRKGMAITSVPIRTNSDLRRSRLVKSVPSYIKLSLFTILRIFMTYKPVKFFAILGITSFMTGFVIGLRFLYFYLSFRGEGHIQSLILAALLMGNGFFLIVIGLVVDLIAVNRKLLEEIQLKIRKFECDLIKQNQHD